MSQGLGRLGFAAIALDWERPFLGPLYAWSSAIQGADEAPGDAKSFDGLLGWLADRLRAEPDSNVRIRGCRKLPLGLTHAKDAKAEDGRAWIGGMPGPLVLARSREDLGPVGIC